MIALILVAFSFFSNTGCFLSESDDAPAYMSYSFIFLGNDDSSDDITEFNITNIDTGESAEVLGELFGLNSLFYEEFVWIAFETNPFRCNVQIVYSTGTRSFDNISVPAGQMAIIIFNSSGSILTYENAADYADILGFNELGRSVSEKSGSFSNINAGKGTF